MSIPPSTNPNGLIRFLLITINFVTASSAARQPCQHEYCDKQNSLFEWVEANGGYVNPKIELTKGPDPNWTIRGVFATDYISRDEVLFRLPPKLTLCGATFCDVVSSLSHELSKGEESFWSPYLSVLQDHEIDSPSVWTKEERDLFSGLYPSNIATTGARDYCDIDPTDETDLRALQLVLARSAGDNYCMIPLHDSINHAQEGFENAQTHRNVPNNDLLIGHNNDEYFTVAIDNIVKNQQLFDSFGYNAFHRLFQDYAFFSQYPRLWVFEDHLGEEISFRMHELEEGYDFDFNPHNLPNQHNISYVYDELSKHLLTVLATEPLGFTQRSPTISSTRYAVALKYRQEYIKALEIAIQHLLLRVRGMSDLSNKYRNIKVEERESQLSRRSTCYHEYCDKQNSLFEWVEANGGYVNPKLELTTGPDPSWKVRGVFATASISHGERIFQLPPNLLLCGASYCDVVNSLSQELSKGPASFWWPYLNVLEDHDIDLPFAWTDEERDLLSGLHPSYMAETGAHEICDMYCDGCNLDMSDATNLLSFQLVKARAAAGKDDVTCMIPLFDAINHAQEGNENTVLMGDYDEEFAVAAIDDIDENNQLFDSFGDNAVHRLFYEYGFFSQYPRLWVFEDHAGEEISFIMYELDEGYDFDFNPHNLPNQHNIRYVYDELSKHLLTVLATEPLGFTQRSPTISSTRYAVALKYRQEYIKALEIAIQHLLLRVRGMSDLSNKYRNIKVEERESQLSRRSTCYHEYCDKQNSLFEWVEANGGYVNPKLELTTGPDPSWKVRGVFATASISHGERIFQLPPNLLLCGASYCDVVNSLSQELSKGPASFWWPYLNVLEDHDIDLPFAWTDEERDLLSGLHPSYMAETGAHEICDMYCDGCNLDMSDATNLLSFQLVKARAAAGKDDVTCMIPLFDAINHAQEGNENTVLMGDYDEEFAVAAIDDIDENNQLFDSFGDNAVHRLFHEYGFFSQYPRLWVFEDNSGEEIRFRMYELEEGYDFDFNPNNLTHQKNISYVYDELSKHLVTVLATEPLGFTQRSPTISSTRYEVALKYRQEYIRAFQIASDYLLRVAGGNTLHEISEVPQSQRENTWKENEL